MFMPKVERSRGKERSSRGSRNQFSRRDNRGSNRDSDRHNRGSERGYSRERPEIQMTKVICDSCKNECEVPFKPNSNKPVYCRDCFSQQNKSKSNSSSNSIPNRDLDLINEKLNKIMKALKIE